MSENRFLLHKGVLEVLERNGIKTGDTQTTTRRAGEKSTVIFGKMPLDKLKKMKEELKEIAGVSCKEGNEKAGEVLRIVFNGETEEELIETTRKSGTEILAGLQKKTGIAGINMV